MGMVSCPVSRSRRKIALAGCCPLRETPATAIRLLLRKSATATGMGAIVPRVNAFAAAQAMTAATRARDRHQRFGRERAPFRFRLCARRSRFMASLTSARIVSEVFFFVFSQATCSGESQTGTRSIFFSFFAMQFLRDHPKHFGDAPRLRDAAARRVRRVAVEHF